jgi:hypothetical protein
MKSETTNAFKFKGGHISKKSIMALNNFHDILLTALKEKCNVYIILPLLPVEISMGISSAIYNEIYFPLIKNFSADKKL